MLQNNGDLWEIFHKILVSRGPHSVRVSKTKGHAFEDAAYMAANAHLAEDAAHNDKADRLAALAATQFYNCNVVNLNSIQKKDLLPTPDF
eukprot:3266538-Karenia_brevis.AAC.1